MAIRIRPISEDSFFNYVCWYCGKKFDSAEKHRTHGCESDNLNDDENDIGCALLMLDWCDHFCCGMSENVCRTKALTRQLKEQGWSRRHEHEYGEIKTKGETKDGNSN